MSQSLKKQRELEKKAMKYGYSGLFATPKTSEDGAKYLERARRMGDTTGTVIGLAMIKNYNAIQKAKREMAMKSRKSKKVTEGNSRAWKVSAVIYCETKEEAIQTLKDDIDIERLSAEEVSE